MNLNIQPVTKFLFQDHFDATSNVIMAAGIIGVRKLGAESFGIETMSIAATRMIGSAIKAGIDLRRINNARANETDNPAASN